MIIAIDFDGTCVKHEFPKIGEDIGAVPVLKELVKNGHQLILWTMRGDVVKSHGDPKAGGMYLTDAINWFKSNDIPLWGIQTNPAQGEWTNSPKAYAHLYIDDSALGCPLLNDFVKSGDRRISKVGRSYVNWSAVREMLVDRDIIIE